MAAPRAVLDRTSVQTTAGLALEGALVYVYEDDQTTLYGKPMYSAASGGTLLSNPFSSGPNGAISCYTPYPGTCQVRVNGVFAPAEFIADPEFGQSGLGPNTGVSVAWAGADLTGTLSAATALQTALDTALAQKANVWFPAGIYNFSTAGFSIPTTYDGIKLLLDYGAILQCRDTGTTFSIAARSFKIEGGQITRKGATASDWTCTPISASGDDFEAHDIHIYNIGGIPFYTTGARPKVTHNFVEECGLLNRSNLTKIGHPLPDPTYANLHDPVGSGVYLNGNSHGTVKENMFKGCGGPVANLNGGDHHDVSHNHFWGAAQTSSVSITTIQAGDGTHNEVQRVSITPTCKTGSFFLGFTNPSAVSGETGYLPIDYSAASLASELQLLASIGIGNVSVTGGFPDWDVEFIGALGHQNVNLMTTDSSVLDMQENCIYDTGSDYSTYVGNTFQNFNQEAMFLGGSHTTHGHNTFMNDVAAPRSIGISLNNTGPWTVANNAIDGTNIAQVLTVSHVCSSIVVNGNEFNGSHLSIQADVTDILFSDNQCPGGFYVVIDSTVTVANFDIANSMFRGFRVGNNTPGVLFEIGNAKVSGCEFADITANGLFARLEPSNKNVTVTDCRLTGSNTIKAIMYGTDAGMGFGAGDGWIFKNNDFQRLDPTTSSTSSVVPLAVALPWISDRLDMDAEYSGYAVLDVAGSIVLTPVMFASFTGAPLSCTIQITGVCAGTLEKVEVSFSKYDTSTTKSAALRQLAGTAGTIFALADFTDNVAATSNQLQPKLTMSLTGDVTRIRWRAWGEYR